MDQIIIKLKNGQEALLRNLSLDTLRFMMKDLDKDWKIEVQTSIGFKDIGPEEIDLVGTLEYNL